MEKFIIAILGASFLHCKYSELFISKIGQLIAYTYPVKEVKHTDEEAVLQVNESVLLKFKLSATGYVTEIACENVK